VKSAIDDGLWLGDEVALAAGAAKRELEQRVQYLEREVVELQEKLEGVEDERDEMYWEVESLQGLLSAEQYAYYDWDEQDEQDSFYWDDRGYVPSENRFEEGYDTSVEPTQPLFVEDILSGVSYVLGEEGPEPLVPDTPEHQG
jgi:regulator of replication initiation timing